MVKATWLILIVLGCHNQTQTKIQACMEEDSKEELHRCTLKIKAGDFDGNGVIDWHDSYLYDHCVNLCPECCVKLSPEVVQYADMDSAIHCPPQECPGSECLCIQGDGGVWYLSPEIGDLD